MRSSGIDRHKRTRAIHTVDAAGALVRPADLPTRCEAVTAYFATFDGPHQAVCECTSLWDWVRDLLVPQGIDLRLAHAKYRKAISDAKVKTDAVDAATMAQWLRVQLIPEAHMIREGMRAVRDLLRSRLVLVSRGMQSPRAIGALLEKYNVAMPAELPELPRLQADLHPAPRALIAKELATIVYAMLTKDEPFNKHFHGQPGTTTKRCTWPRLANPLTSLLPSGHAAMIGEPGGRSPVYS